MYYFLLYVNKLPYIIRIFAFIRNDLILVRILHTQLVHGPVFDLFKINSALDAVLGVIVLRL